MSIRLLAVAALSCAISSAATAQDAASGQPQPPAEKKVCRSVVATGTILAKRMCLTKAEWEEFRARNEAHNDMFRDKKNVSLRPEDGN